MIRIASDIFMKEQKDNIQKAMRVFSILIIICGFQAIIRNAHEKQSFFTYFY